MPQDHTQNPKKEERREKTREWAKTSSQSKTRTLKGKRTTLKSNEGGPQNKTKPSTGTGRRE